MITHESIHVISKFSSSCPIGPFITSHILLQQHWIPCQSSNTLVTFLFQAFVSCFSFCLYCSKCLLFCFLININLLIKLWASQYCLSLPHDLIMQSQSQYSFKHKLLKFWLWILRDMSTCVPLQAFCLWRTLQVKNVFCVT